MVVIDPVYVTEVLNDILSRRGLSVSLVLKDSQVSSAGQQCEKNPAARTSCIADWVSKNAAVIKSLERLLGEVRREEKKAAGRIYIPWIQALEDIKPVSFGRFQDTEYAVQEGGLVQAATAEEKKGGD